MNLGVFTFEKDEDCNVIASLLKRYYREMKNPLMTYALYSKFIAAASTYRKFLSHLQPHNTECLEPALLVPLQVLLTLFWWVLTLFS